MRYIAILAFLLLPSMINAAPCNFDCPTVTLQSGSGSVFIVGGGDSNISVAGVDAADNTYGGGARGGFSQLSDGGFAHVGQPFSLSGVMAVGGVLLAINGVLAQN